MAKTLLRTAIIFCLLINFQSCDFQQHQNDDQKLFEKIKENNQIINTVDFPGLMNAINEFKEGKELLIESNLKIEIPDFSFKNVDFSEAALVSDGKDKRLFSFKVRHESRDEVYTLLVEENNKDYSFFLVLIEVAKINYGKLKFGLDSSLKIIPLDGKKEDGKWKSGLTTKTRIASQCIQEIIITPRSIIPNESPTTGAVYPDEFHYEAGNFVWDVSIVMGPCGGGDSGGSEGGGEGDIWNNGDIPPGVGGGGGSGIFGDPGNYTVSFPVFSTVMLDILEGVIDAEIDPNKKRMMQLTHIYNYYGAEGRYFAMVIANEYLNIPGLGQREIAEVNRVVDLTYRTLLELRGEIMMGIIRPVLEVADPFIELALWDSGINVFFNVSKLVLESKYLITAVKFTSAAIKPASEIVSTIKANILVASDLSSITLKLASKSVVGIKGHSASTYIVRNVSKTEVTNFFNSITQGSKGVSIQNGAITRVDLGNGAYVQLRKFASVKSMGQLGEHWTIEVNMGLLNQYLKEIKFVF